ncbi:MAG TPA: SDR family oxidoreductase [Mycobacteriales bacterium]|jgi:hypothetical protein|nr:SDR family oxidoreductase [Mycobacteriales bacterium]
MSKTNAPLAGRRILITGAARGIGAALARECVQRGGRVALVGLEPAELAKRAAQLGSAAMWTAADVTSTPELQRAVGAMTERWGGLDVVVANAGIASYGTVRTTDPESFARVVDINLTGAFRTLHAAASPLAASRGYALVMGSVASFVQLPGLAAYCASKAGVEALAGVVRAEWAHHGVMVGSAHPSWIDTDLVRDAQADLPSFRAARRAMPWPTNSTTSVAVCASALADGIAQRARRVYVPRAALLVHLSRVLLASAAASRLVHRASAELIDQMEQEVTALGRSTSVRQQAADAARTDG